MFYALIYKKTINNYNNASFHNNFCYTKELFFHNILKRYLIYLDKTNSVYKMKWLYVHDF